MSNRFWIYWAVAAPLTLVVMGAMGVFALRQSQQHKRDTEEARRDIQLKLL
jgi:heme/copper-type cytochrome/quinol oxidase subunit 2